MELVFRHADGVAGALPAKPPADRPRWRASEGRGFRAGRSWRGDEVHAAQAEERCGGEEVAVVGIDLGEAVFRRAGEVQGVGSTEEGGGGRRGHDAVEPGQDRVGEWEPAKGATGAIAAKLIELGAVLLGIEVAFAQAAVERADDLGLGVPAGSDLALRGQLSHRFASRVIQIQPDEIAGVEIEHFSARRGRRRSAR